MANQRLPYPLYGVASVGQSVFWDFGAYDSPMFISAMIQKQAKGSSVWIDVGYPENCLTIFSGSDLDYRFRVGTRDRSGAWNYSSPTDYVVASAPLPPIGILAPVNTGLPTILGVAQVGQSLLAGPGTWANSPTGYAYQWQRFASGVWADISGATGASYTPVLADEGLTLRVIVSASGAGAVTVAAASATAAVAAAGPALVITPSAGAANLGDALTFTLSEAVASFAVTAGGETLPVTGSGLSRALASAYVPGTMTIAAATADGRTATATVEVGSTAPGSVKLVRAYDLPSSVVGRVPAGFTATGLSRITSGALAGHWLVADDGRLKEGDGSTFAPAVHVLTPDFSAILRTISVGNSTHSAQGVAFDTLRGGFWVALSGSGWVRYFGLDGVEDTALSFQLNAITGLTSWVPNGLCYVPSLDQLIVMSSTGKSVRRFYANPANVPTGGNRHVAGVSYNLTGITGTTTDNSPDHLFYDAANDRVFFTLGANGSNGTVRRFDNATTRTSDPDVGTPVWTLPGADAIEGLHLDLASNTAFTCNDRGYHNGGNATLKNTVNRYLLTA